MAEESRLCAFCNVAMAAAISRGSTLACPGGVSDGRGWGAVPLSPFFLGVAASLLPTAAWPVAVAVVVAAGGLGAAGSRGWSVSEAQSEDEAGGCSSDMMTSLRLRAC